MRAQEKEVRREEEEVDVPVRFVQTMDAAIAFPGRACAVLVEATKILAGLAWHGPCSRRRSRAAMVVFAAASRGEVAMDIQKAIRERQSTRAMFDPERKIPEAQLRQMLEGARWAPTAHNMQNFEVIVVDDRALLDALSNIRGGVSQAFVEENYAQLSFSEEELQRKRVGILGTMFPASWRTPGVKPRVDEEHAHSILGAPIKMCATLLVVLYDARKRAPASEGDALGMMSLGCVMQNMWLVAQSLGIGYQIQSVFGSDHVEREARRLLTFPDHFKIAFAVRLGYPKAIEPYLRVRREIEDFTHRNGFGPKRARGPG